IGKTPEEKEQEQISEYMEKLEEIDRRSGAPRRIRDIAILLDNIDNSLKSIITELVADTGLGENAKVKAAMTAINEATTAKNRGMKELVQAEQEALPIRGQLAPLLA
ncbi:MAG: hypothetical protein LBD45_06150, partial [Bacteroidales bacterium]|nr:hypothetical protein [Bacteroidales bacterium]